MNKSLPLTHGRRWSTRSERAKLLAALDRSGLSVAAFARQHGIKYTTFCSWRQQRKQAKRLVDFAEVELRAPVTSAELVIELGSQARARVSSADQIGLAAQLIHQLNAA